MKILPAGTFPAPNLRNKIRKEIHERGFTLIELLVALALLLGLTGAIVVSFRHTRENRNLEAATQQLMAELRFAGTLAVTSGDEIRIYFDTENGSYQIWAMAIGGTTTEESETEGMATPSEAVVLPHPIEFSGINFPETPGTSETITGEADETGWPDGTGWIAFNPDRTATVAEIVLKSPNEVERKINVKANGWIGKATDEAE